MARVTVVSIRSNRPLRQWLLIVAIAVGVIGMHNLVGPAAAHHAGYHTAGIAQAHPYLAEPLPASASGCCPCMGALMGHPCQAVLGTDALTIAAAMLLAAMATSHDAPVPMAGGSASTFPARGPPRSGVRFAQLGVWRR